MSSTAASGFVFFLLSVQVIQSMETWGVIYTSPDICGVIGSSVEISCNYTYPSTIRDQDIRKRFWFMKEKNGQPVDLMSDSQYTGRVKNKCHKHRCTLIISDLRKSDGAMYEFRFITNFHGYTGSPGVTLAVTGPGLEVMVSKVDSTRVGLECLSSYVLPIRPSYIWYKDGVKIETRSSSLSVFFGSSNSYSCAEQEQKNICSLPVYAPKLPSVSVSPSAEIEEGRSVTLTCSNDANPAARYSWHKVNQNLDIKTPQFFFSSIQSSDSGWYYCDSVNQMGTNSSELIYIDVKYAPRFPSVSVSPSAEIMEGSSVTLTCSSDANPAASYTWYKVDEDLPKASGRFFIITNFTAKHTGNYSCEAKNTIGRSHSTFHLSLSAVVDNKTMVLQIIYWILAVLVLSSLILFFLWLRKKKAVISTTEPDEYAETLELDVYHTYENFSDDAAQPEDTEDFKDYTLQIYDKLLELHRTEESVTSEGDSLDGN